MNTPLSLKLRELTSTLNDAADALSVARGIVEALEGPPPVGVVQWNGGTGDLDMKGTPERLAIVQAVAGLLVVADRVNALTIPTAKVFDDGESGAIRVELTLLPENIGEARVHVWANLEPWVDALGKQAHDMGLTRPVAEPESSPVSVGAVSVVPPSFPGALANELKRVRELATRYQALPDRVGEVAAKLMEQDLTEAEQAISRYDVAQMIILYQRLLEWKD